MAMSFEDYICKIIDFERNGGDVHQLNALLSLGCDIGSEIPKKLEVLFADYLDRPGKEQVIALALMVAREFLVSTSSPEKHLLIVGQLLDWGAIDFNEALDLLALDRGHMQRMCNDGKNILIMAETLREDKDLFNVSPADFEPITKALSNLKQRIQL